MRIIADLHTHSRFSHGAGFVLENVTAAMARGLEAVGIADHGPRSLPWVRASLQDFAQLTEEVADLNRRTSPFRCLAGAECNIVSARGDLDLPEDIRAGLDIVLAGLHPHILPRSPGDWLVLTGWNWAARLTDRFRRRARQQNTRAVVEAVYRHEIDLITHPGHHLEIETAELARACAERDTAMEISARHRSMTVAFCRVAAREGARFVISSDAHRPDDVGRLDRGIAIARAAGLRPDQVINSDQGGLREWLQCKQSRRRAGRNSGAGEVGPASSWRGARPEEARSYWADWAEQGKIH